MLIWVGCPYGYEAWGIMHKDKLYYRAARVSWGLRYVWGASACRCTISTILTIHTPFHTTVGHKT